MIFSVYRLLNKRFAEHETINLNMIVIYFSEIT